MSWSVVQADCLNFLRSQPEGSADLVFGSPPYETARLYLEDGKDLAIARNTEAWVEWMVEVYRECIRVCKGLVAFVVEGQTRSYRYSCGPFLLVADLHRAGFCLRKPPIYRRVGIPGSGGPDWLRNDYEPIICVSRPGKLPWSDNTACGHPPKWAPGGEMSYRNAEGERKNAVPKIEAKDGDIVPRGRAGNSVGYASMEERNNVGPHRAQRSAGSVYVPPEKANPGNVIDCAAGGGQMGNPLCHENEAPFPEALARFFVLSFCPPGGLVIDPFAGSGTTLAVAFSLGRRAMGCDIRQSQCDLTSRRLAGVTPTMFPE